MEPVKYCHIAVRLKIKQKKKQKEITLKQVILKPANHDTRPAVKLH